MAIFWPQGQFFSVDQKIFDSIISCAYLERHFEPSYAPIPQYIWSSSAKIHILGQNIMFWPKIAIFNGPKIFKCCSADRAHRVCNFELSSALLAQCILSGSPNEPNGAPAAPPPTAITILWVRCPDKLERAPRLIVRADLCTLGSACVHWKFFRTRTFFRILPRPKRAKRGQEAAKFFCFQ